jgi:hypothetical protein
MLVSEIVNRCLLLFADDTGNPTYLPKSTLVTFFNMCNKVLTDELDCFYKHVIIKLVENQPVYQLPDDLRTVLWVYRNNKLITPTSVRRLEEMDDEWRTRRGKADYYFLDSTVRTRMRVYKIPDDTGDEFIFTQDDGVVIAIDPASTLQFDAQSSNFTVGVDVTGQTSGAVGELVYVQQSNGYSGKLYFSSITGTFQDNENLLQVATTRAVANGTQVDTTSTDTFKFVPDTNGVVVEITGGENVYNFENEQGEPSTDGVISNMVTVDTGEYNMLVSYSYYLPEMSLEDELPQPYRNSEELYISYIMSQMYIVEAVEQDWEKVKYYLGKFARRSGIDFTKLWTPQRQYQQEPYVAGTQAPERARLPDEYGRTEY